MPLDYWGHFVWYGSVPLCLQDIDPHNRPTNTVRGIEIRYYWEILFISYEDQILNLEVHDGIQRAVGKRHETDAEEIRPCNNINWLPLKLPLHYHRQRGRLRIKWNVNINKWTGFALQDGLHDRWTWTSLVRGSTTFLYWISEVRISMEKSGFYAAVDHTFISLCVFNYPCSRRGVWGYVCLFTYVTQKLLLQLILFFTQEVLFPWLGPPVFW